jgi:hypothetical protein
MIALLCCYIQWVFLQRQKAALQCFYEGEQIAVVLFWIDRNPDPTPDPSPFFSDFKDAKKFHIFFYRRHIISISKIEFFAKFLC